MQKPCTCGAAMHIRLRTVVFQNKVEIENVPIYSCERCQRSEVFPPIKPELTGFIRTLGDKPDAAVVPFQDLSELAYLLHKATSREHRHIPVEQIVEERVNELLDMLLLAGSLAEKAWMEDVQHRLRQITSHLPAAYRSI